jgi:hypothetical protein
MRKMLNKILARHGYVLNKLPPAAKNAQPATDDLKNAEEVVPPVAQEDISIEVENDADAPKLLLENEQERVLFPQNPDKLFQPLYYKTVYPDIGGGNLTPLEHYRRIGWEEGKNPNPFLYSNWYRRRYPDSKNAGINPMDHYFLYGAELDYNPGPRFSGKAYKALYPEIGKTNPLLHYFTSGFFGGNTYALVSAAKTIMANCAESDAEPNHTGLRIARPFLSRLDHEKWREFAEAVNIHYPALSKAWKENDACLFANLVCDLAFNKAKLSNMIVHCSRPVMQAGFAEDPMAQARLIIGLIAECSGLPITEQIEILDSADKGWRSHPVVRFAKTLLEFAASNLDSAMDSAYDLSSVPGYTTCYHDLNIMGYETGFLRNQEIRKKYVIYADLSNHFCHIPFHAFTFEQSKPYLMGYLCCAGWQPFSVEPRRDNGDISFAESFNSSMAKEIRRSILDGDFTYCARGSCLAIYDVFGDIHHDHSDQADRIASGICGNVSMVEAVIANKVLMPRDKISDELELKLLENNHADTIIPPRYISILLDSSCNIMCPSCRNACYRVSDEKAGELIALYDREVYPLLRSGHKCDIEVDGSGEALFSPLGRHILKGINPALTPGTRITLRTNGLLLTENMWYKTLGDTRKSIGHIRVSIDAGSKEAYEKLRYPGKWETINANMRFMGTLVAGGELKSLTLCAIIRLCSWDTIMNLAELAKGWHVESLTLLRYLNKTTTDVKTFGSEDVLSPDHPLYADVRKMIADVSDYCRKNGIRLILRCSG